MSDIKILYICDEQKCKCCDGTCKYTLDINHAANRDSLDGRVFMRIDGYDPSIITFIEMKEEKDE